MNNLQTQAQKQLKQYIERVENLETQRKDLAADIKELLDEAKAKGFDTKIIRKVLAIRKKSKEDYLDEAALLETYLACVSWLNTPLGAEASKQSDQSMSEEAAAA